MGARRALALAAIAAGIALVAFLSPILGENFHSVIEGKVYRSAQLDANDLRARAAEVGLASVVSVRRARPDEAWYGAEQATTDRLELELVHVSLGALRMPSRRLLRELVQALDAAPRPMLLHCRAGVERSGLASAVVLLLDGKSVAAARDQFSFEYGFHPLLSQSELPRVLDRYEHFLAEAGIGSSADTFKRWVDQSYIAEFYQAELEIVDFPRTARAGRPLAVTLRVTNGSPDPMPFRATGDFGVRVGTVIEGVSVADYRREARPGAQHLELAPGESHLFDLTLAPLPLPGTYRLTLDLVNERVAWFADMGSNALVHEFEVAPISQVATGP